MADTTNIVETQNQETPSNTTVTTPASTIVDNASDQAEVERLRKENEQREMRIRQLENERKAREEAEEAARKKQLEENEEYKQLYEREAQELKRLREEREAETRRSELNSKTADILQAYPEAVIKAATIAGLGLTDDSEAAVSSLKTRLDELQQTVAPGSVAPTVTSNNSAAAAVVPGATPNGSQPQGLGRPRNLGNDNGSTELSPEANPAKVGEYLRNLPVIDKIKLDSGYYKPSV